jgi:hypothetical protein
VLLIPSCGRPPREAVIVAFPRKVDTMLPRANLARVEPNRSGSLSRGKGISVCCVLCQLRCSCGVDQQPKEGVCRARQPILGFIYRAVDCPEDVARWCLVALCLAHRCHSMDLWEQEKRNISFERRESAAGTNILISCHAPNLKYRT